MPYISYLFSLLTAVFLVGAVSGLAAYTIARNRRILAQAQAPTPVGADVWGTPVRTFTVFAAVLFAVIVLPILTPPSAISFTDVAITVLLLAGIAWATPAGIIAPTEVSSALIGAGPVLVAAGTAIAIYAVKGEVAYYEHGWHSRAPLVGLGLGLAVAGVIRARFGIPESTWYATHVPPAAGQGQGAPQQQAQASASPAQAGFGAQGVSVPAPKAGGKHLVLPPLGDLGRALKARVQGQPTAIAKIVRALGERKDFFSTHSIEPLVMIIAGPESCGKEHLARELAKILNGRFQSLNQRGDHAGDDLYVGMLDSFRIKGDAAVLHIGGFQGNKRASSLIGDILLKGHHSGDDWSRAIITLPIVYDQPLPADRWEMVDALSPLVDRTLLARAIIIPMVALDEPVLIAVGRLIAVDEFRKHGVEVVRISENALVEMIADRDHTLAGAKPVLNAVQSAIGTMIAGAKAKSWKRVDLLHDGTAITMTEAAKA